MFIGFILIKDFFFYFGILGMIEFINSYYVNSKCMLGKRKYVYKVYIYNECVIIC